MNNKLKQTLLIICAVTALAMAWIVPLDQAAVKAIDDGFTRASITYATARAANAALSVAESTQVGMNIIVAGGQVSPGKLLHPLNELVGQFADLMLAASVVFGVAKLAMIVSGSTAVSATFSCLMILWGIMIHRRVLVPRLLQTTLMLAIILRFSIPVTMLSSETVFQQFFKQHYETSQQALKLDDQPQSPAKLTDWVNDVRKQAQHWIDNAIGMIALFLMQTLIVPALMFWMIVAGSRYVLRGGRE